jgi:hypothetical protein
MMVRKLVTLRRVLFFTVAGIIGAFAAQCFQVPISVASDSAKTNPVSVKALEETMPIGHLEVPLGTVVRVTGTTVDGDTFRTKAAAGKIFLRIDTVDGKALEEPVVFEFGRAFPRDADQIPEPPADEWFDYYVHEEGQFGGVVTPPRKLGIPDAAMIANDGFHYRRYICVHGSARK